MLVTKRQLRKLILEAANNAQQITNSDEFIKEIFMKESLYRLTYLRRFITEFSMLLLTLREIAENWDLEIDKTLQHPDIKTSVDGVLSIGGNQIIFDSEFQENFLRPAGEIMTALHSILHDSTRRSLMSIQREFSKIVRAYNNEWFEYAKQGEADAMEDFLDFVGQYSISGSTTENPVIYIANEWKRSGYAMSNLVPKVDGVFASAGITPLALPEILETTAFFFKDAHLNEKLEKDIATKVGHINHYISYMLLNTKDEYANYIEEFITLVREEKPEVFASQLTINPDLDLSNGES